jgi:hypothetical protein
MRLPRKVNQAGRLFKELKFFCVVEANKKRACDSTTSKLLKFQASGFNLSQKFHCLRFGERHKQEESASEKDKTNKPERNSSQSQFLNSFAE